MSSCTFGRPTWNFARLFAEGLVDTGVGIPAEQTTQIFEPLHTTKPGGTGLGLYIVQEVVAAHNGQVAVQSVVDQGSTFTITLPLLGHEETT
jgi:two-component system sensor histidine kinase FlrB